MRARKKGGIREKLVLGKVSLGGLQRDIQLTKIDKWLLARFFKGGRQLLSSGHSVVAKDGIIDPLMFHLDCVQLSFF